MYLFYLNAEALYIKDFLFFFFIDITDKHILATFYCFRVFSLDNFSYILSALEIRVHFFRKQLT